MQQAFYVRIIVPEVLYPNYAKNFVENVRISIDKYTFKY